MMRVPELVKTVLRRFRSPVTWLAIFSAVYSAVLVPEFDLPEWTQVAAYAATLFGVVNNPTEYKKF